MKENEYHPVIIRKHPLAVLRNLFVLEIASVITFFIVARFTNYEQLYINFSLTKIFSYRIAEFLFISISEFLIISLIFLSWFFETFEFIPSGVIHKRGIVFRNKTIMTFGHPLSVSVIRNPLSRLFNFGTVLFQDGASRTNLKISFIGDPESYVSFLSNNRGEGGEKEFKNLPLSELLGSRESETLEFKSTFRYDARQGKVTKELEHAVMKTVAAFLNSHGGTLVVGVTDQGVVSGIEPDYKTLKKQSSDGFELHFTTLFNNCIGAEFRDLVSVRFEKGGDRDVAVIEVLPSQKPLYFIGENSEHFFIRTGNATTDLSFRKAASYIDSHWGKNK